MDPPIINMNRVRGGEGKGYVVRKSSSLPISKRHIRYQMAMLPKLDRPRACTLITMR